MLDATIARLPSLILGAIVFALFYLLSALVSQLIRRTTRGHVSSSGSNAAVGQTSGSGSKRILIIAKIFRTVRTMVGLRCS